MSTMGYYIVMGVFRGAIHRRVSGSRIRRTTRAQGATFLK